MPTTQESLPRRWAHVQGVAARAHSLAPVLGADADLLEAAAWLHDIGYAPGLADTGLHALDGARYLRDTQHADAMLCRLVSATRSNPASTSAAIPCRLQT
jgi:putative nucleotidyltransferase with HDIG domain